MRRKSCGVRYSIPARLFTTSNPIMIDPIGCPPFFARVPPWIRTALASVGPSDRHMSTWRKMLLQNVKTQVHGRDGHPDSCVDYGDNDVELYAC